MRRVAVTGGSGFIGTNLIEYYRQRHVPVVNLDAREPRCSTHREFWRRTDVLDAACLHDEFSRFKPTDVVHLAARTDLDESAGLEGYAANTRGTQNLLSALTRMPQLRRLFFASTMLVAKVGHRPSHDQDYCPSTTYGRSKVIAERLIRDFKAEHVSWVIGRPTSIWGPWFGEPYLKFFRLVRRGLYVSPRESAATKTFGYVENTIRQIDRLLTTDALTVQGRTFYLGDEPPLNIADWADLIAAQHGAMRPRRVPVSILRVAAKAGDLLARVGMSLPMTSFRLRNMTTDNIIDLSPIVAIAGEPEVRTEEGVRRTIDWLQAGLR